MRYVVDIPSELAEEINRQVSSGRFKTPQEFLLIAAQNQAYLETSEPDLPSGVVSQVYATTQFSPMNRAVGNARLLLLPDLSRVKTVNLGDIARPNYLWGQYNRLLPVKVVVRVAANLASEYSSEYFPLTELQERASETARDLGKLVQRKDRLMGHKRGSIISAGLPFGRKQDKARSRFENQFVGFMTKSRVEGAAPALKFLDFKRDERNTVLAGLTDPGLRFCMLSNPVIDKEDYSLAFSKEEVSFLLDHIATQVPGEAKLMHLVMSSIKKGIATPDDLTPLVKSYDSSWKDNEAIAMRVGVVSRLNELGLVDRHKNGVKVTYMLSNLGEQYTAHLSKPEGDFEGKAKEAHLRAK